MILKLLQIYCKTTFSFLLLVLTVHKQYKKLFHKM